MNSKRGSRFTFTEDHLKILHEAYNSGVNCVKKCVAGEIKRLSEQIECSEDVIKVCTFSECKVAPNALKSILSSILNLAK